MTATRLSPCDIRIRHMKFNRLNPFEKLSPMKRAFTLVELLVVIGILGILTAVLLGVLSGGTESARAAKCLTNMRNLANGCQSYGMATGHYPFAGSFEVFDLDESDGISNLKKVYAERAGWISWNSQDTYRGSTKPSSHAASQAFFASAYNQDDTVRDYCLTNGTLWKFVTENRDVYVCPAHVRKYDQKRPCWSYVMNSYFGWDNSKGSKPKDSRYWGVLYGTLTRADRILMFAEIPYMGVEREAKDDEGSGTALDCTLQYRTQDGGEIIGFNHASGKKSKFAHVVFADGHVDKITWPKDGLSENDVRELTKWLCEGTDYGFNGRKYEKLTND